MGTAHKSGLLSLCCVAGCFAHVNRQLVCKHLQGLEYVLHALPTTLLFLLQEL